MTGDQARQAIELLRHLPAGELIGHGRLELRQTEQGKIEIHRTTAELQNIYLLFEGAEVSENVPVAVRVRRPLDSEAAVDLATISYFRCGELVVEGSLPYVVGL